MRHHLSIKQREQGKALSYDLGTSLAKLHSISFKEAGLFGKGLCIDTLFEEGSSPCYTFCLEHLVPGALAFKRLGSQLSEQMLTFLQTHRDLLPLVKGGGVLVHSDFKPVNLLWSEVNRLTVLDWEFAHSGHALFDFGILLRHYLDFPLRLNDLEKGYVEAGGSLPDNWLQIARLLDFVNIIQLLNTSGERPELFTSLIKSAQLTISAWDNLDSRLNLPC